MASKEERLAKKILGSNNIRRVETGETPFTKKYKIVVFTPLEKTDELTFAMASAGAGTIGNYTVCSFRMKGAGTFMGNEKTDPLVGSKGKFEMAEEIRLEMICSRKNLKKAIDKMYEVHPYDEPAFEIYEVLTREKRGGQMITVTLKKKTAAKDLLNRINPEIKLSVLPKDLKMIKIKECIIDSSDKEEVKLSNYPAGILYIKKNKKKLKAYLT